MRPRSSRPSSSRLGTLVAYGLGAVFACLAAYDLAYVIDALDDILDAHTAHRETLDQSSSHLG